MKRSKKQAVQDEIAALAALPDREIDTSRIPEATNWSGAITGKFDRRTNRNVIVLESESSAERFWAAMSARFGNLFEFGNPSAQTGRMPRERLGRRVQASFRAWLADLSELRPWFLRRPQTTEDSLSERRNRPAEVEQIDSIQPSLGLEDLWKNLVQRFHPLITGMISSLDFSRPDLIDDITQEVYVTVVKAIKEHQFFDEKTVVIAVKNAIIDVMQRRMGASPQPGYSVNSAPVEGTSPRIRTSPLDQAVVDVLADLGPSELPTRASDEDRIILRLYLLGLTAKQISELPHMNLTETEIKLRFSRLFMHTHAPAKKAQRK